MNKENFNFYQFILFMLCLSTQIEGTAVNYQLLNPTVQNFSSRISSGNTIDTDEIKKSFDFIPYHCTSVKWEAEKFSRLIDVTASTRDAAFEKLGHNRFHTFVTDCNSIFNSGTLKYKEQFALFVLLTEVQRQMDYHLKYIQTTVEMESRIPDEQFSFLFDSDSARSRSISVQSSIASTQHISDCEQTSEDSDHRSATTDEVTFLFVSLDGRALQPSSFIYYQKKLPDDQSPLCITCNLQSVKIDKIDTLKEAIQGIDSTKNLREIIFTNGSSRKFNLLFDFLRDLSAKRTHERPITIIYSTTSESQKAYTKLATLRGVMHAALDMHTLTVTGERKLESIHACQRVMSDFSDESLNSINSVLESTAVSK